jgi:excisionase family DNA binding protein
VIAADNGMLPMMVRMFRWFRPTAKRSKFMTKGEVAEFFGVSKSTIDRWLRDGKLPRAKRRFGLKRWEYERIAPLRKSKPGI